MHAHAAHTQGAVAVCALARHTPLFGQQQHIGNLARFLHLLAPDIGQQQAFPAVVQALVVQRDGL
ncbi:hypothetical protein D9M69_727270 [compost metagenome]